MQNMFIPENDGNTYNMRLKRVCMCERACARMHELGEAVQGSASTVPGFRVQTVVQTVETGYRPSHRQTIEKTYAKCTDRRDLEKAFPLNPHPEQSLRSLDLG